MIASAASAAEVAVGVHGDRRVAGEHGEKLAMNVVLGHFRDGDAHVAGFQEPGVAPRGTALTVEGTSNNEEVDDDVCIHLARHCPSYRP